MTSAVFFDMDGTLIDSERFWQQAFLELAAREGLQDLDPERFYLGLIGATVDQCRHQIADWLPAAVEPDGFLSAWRARVDDLERGQVHLKPGARELVEALRLAQVPMAVVTSSERASALALLARSDLLPAMEFVIAADDVTRTKPDPEPYLMAARQMGVDIADCVIFEDSNTGTTAALDAGARVAQIPDLIPPSAELRGAGHVIADSLLEAAGRLGLI